MKQTYEIEKHINGWQRVIITFTVDQTPRWWQFWEKRIDSKKFQYSILDESTDYIRAKEYYNETYGEQPKHYICYCGTGYDEIECNSCGHNGVYVTEV